MINDPWLTTSIMAKRAVAKGEARKRHELSIEAQGAFHYVYGPYAKPVLTIDPGDVVVVETEDAFGGVITSETGQPDRETEFPVSQSAMRPDRGQRRGEGRLPRRDDPCGRDARRAAGRHHLHHPGIRRSGRDRIDRLAQSAAAGAGAQGACRYQRRALERQDHAALPALHRHHRHFAADRGDLLAAAGLSRRQHGPARCRARRDPLLSGAYQGRTALCRRLPRRTGRWRVVGRRDRAARDRDACRSTSSRAGASPGRGSRRRTSS